MQTKSLPSTEGITHVAKGQHLLVTLSGCDTQLLNDEAALRSLVEEAAKATGATVLQVASQKFSPQGVTAIAVLAESHASLHTYPESAVVFWDCFTCGDTCKPELSVPVLARVLSPISVDQTIVQREVRL